MTFESLADGRLVLALRGAEERTIEHLEVHFGTFELLER